MNPSEIIETLKLQPLPEEGGLFAETYRASLELPVAVLGGRYTGDRSIGTAIYYMLLPGMVSRLHRLPGDEIFHFYLGDPVEQLRLHGDGRSEVVTIGSELMQGERLQTVVPGGVWQGSRLHQGGAFALLGTTMAPGFAFEDFELGLREKLVRQFPARRAIIEALTSASG